MALLIGREEGAPQVEHAPRHPGVAAGVLQQRSADGTVRLVTPAGRERSDDVCGRSRQSGSRQRGGRAPPGGSPLKYSVLRKEPEVARKESDFFFFFFEFMINIFHAK